MSYDWEKMRKEEGPVLETMTFLDAACVSFAPQRSVRAVKAFADMTATQEEVRVAEGETQKSARKVVERARRELRSLGASPEVDLRGMTAEEALVELDRFLDQAMMGKLSEVRIIHGKGTGVVRSAVREHLKRSRYVSTFRPGRYGEGEDGVTIAQLR